MEFGELEKLRKKYAEKRRKIIMITAIVIIVIIGLIMMGTGDFSSVISVLIFGITAGVVITELTTRKEASDYRKAYKDYFVETTMKKYFTDLNYSHRAGMSRVTLDMTNMINTGSRFTSNDYTTGKYKGTLFSQADIKIEEEYTDSDGDTHYTTIFSGRWMIFEFPKKFNFRIMIKGKRGGNILIKRKRTGDKKRKYEKIEVESGEFNKLFKLYAEDGFETFYLLDPAFIHNLTELGIESGGKILLCFVDNQLHVGINNYTDSFEPPRKVSQALNEQAEFQKAEKEVGMITRFVDQLKLAGKLWEGGAEVDGVNTSTAGNLRTNVLGSANPRVNNSGTNIPEGRNVMTANLGSVPKNTGQGAGSSKANVIRNNSPGDNPQNPGINIKQGNTQVNVQNTISEKSAANIPAPITTDKDVDTNNNLQP